MRFLLNFSVPLFIFTFVTPLKASKVQVVALEDNVFYTQGDPTIPKITLQLENTVLAEMPEVLIWQIGLDIVPAASAVGTVGFEAASEPTDYLFAGSSSPFAIPSLPQPAPPSSVVVSDALIFASTGVPLLANTPKSIVLLDFSVSANAEGLFNLVLSPFDANSISSSSWSPQLVFNPMDAMEFDNAQVGSSFESRIVASIHITSVPEPSTVIPFGLGFLCLATQRNRAKTHAPSNAASR